MNRAFQRIFAKEFNESSLWFSVGASPDHRAVVTPGGAVCTQLFLSGALLEVRGRVGDMMHARMADPTGAFSLNIGRAQDAVADTLAELDIPCFITVTGEAAMTESGGHTRCFVLAGEVRETDRQVRDAWVIRAADLTLARIHALREVLHSGTGPDPLKRAIRHYEIDDASLKEMTVMVGAALGSVSTAPSAHTEVKGPAEIVLGIIREFCGQKGMPLDEIARRAQKFGLGRDDVVRAVETLLLEDECYQPSKGVIKLL